MRAVPLFLLQTGSTIQARAELNVMKVVIILAAVFLAIAVVYIISKAITGYLNSPAYIEKKKNRPTSAKDISEIAASCSLVKEERDVFALICKAHDTPNIKYLVRDYEAMRECLKEQFKVFDRAEDETGKSQLFALQKKLFKVFRQQERIKNSKNISVNTIFTLTVAKGFHYKLQLTENSSEAMILSIPPTLKSDQLPKPLEKINFIFELDDGTPYNLESRVVRYQAGKDNAQQMVIVHSDKISALQKREQERAELNLPCKFYSVKVSVEGSGKKERVNYIPSEKAYEGVLEDISTGGCRLVTNLPIKAEQNIYIEGSFNMRQSDVAVGSIVRTTKRSDGIFILHIRFIKIELKVVNRIQAMVNKYDG